MKYFALFILGGFVFLLCGCSTPPSAHFTIPRRILPDHEPVIPPFDTAGRIVAMSESLIHDLIRERVRYLTMNPDHETLVTLTIEAAGWLEDNGYDVIHREKIRNALNDIPVERIPRFPEPGTMRELALDVAITLEADTMVYLETASVRYNRDSAIKEPFHEREAILVPAELDATLSVQRIGEGGRRTRGVRLTARQLGAATATIQPETGLVGYQPVASVDQPSMQPFYWSPAKRKDFERGHVPPIPEETAERMMREVMAALARGHSTP